MSSDRTPERRRQLVLTEDREPWERQPGETTKAYEAFAIYRDLMYNRSIAKVAQALGKGFTTVAEWCNRNRWVERSDLFLAYLDRRYRESREDEIAKDAQTDVEMSRYIGRLAAARLTGADTEVKQESQLPVTGIDWNQLSATDALTAWREAVKIRRLATGQPTDLTAQMGRITQHEFLAFAEGLYDVLMPFVPEEDQPRAAAAVQLFFTTGRAR